VCWWKDNNQQPAPFSSVSFVSLVILADRWEWDEPRAS
jgi:hypothetical protein